MSIMSWPSLSLFSTKPVPRCKGKVSAGAITKELLRDLPPGRIVVLAHRDLDEVIAQELIDRKVKAVINCEPTMSGTYPTQGPLMLLKQEISIWEADRAAFEPLSAQSELSIYEDFMIGGSSAQPLPCRAFTKSEWLQQYQQANTNITQALADFIDNTLSHAMQEKAIVMEPLPLLSLHTVMEGKHVLIVARGKGYKQALSEAADFIHDVRPVLIGVDGGADALLECGYRPDIIIGDMDSVTDRALLCGAELVVHAYPNGTAPGLARLESLGVTGQLFPCFGTSEDAALLLAYENQGEWIVTVGAHTHMIDFMEKGREGMGSTLLVRMKLGARLVDIKSIGLFYRHSASKRKDAWLTVSLALFFVLLALLQTHWITKRISHAVWQWGG